MARQAKYAALFLAGMLALAVWLLWFRGDNAVFGGTQRWGRGPLKVSERTYYTERIRAVVNTWRDIALRAKRDDSGRIEDPVFTCLVVDTAARRVWIESNGHVLADSEAELPPQMEWKLRRSAPEGTVELAPLRRFRIPGIDSARLSPERIALIGTLKAQEYLHFSFGPSGDFGALSYGSGPCNVKFNYDSLSQTRGQETYGSVVVNDADYEQAKATFGASGAVASESAALSEAKAAWRRVEKALYREIERQVVIQGLPLRRLEVTCGPDCTAASADLTAARGSGLFDAFRHGPSSAEVYLRIDYLGDDVWYARSGPHPQQGVPGPIRLDLEFLVPIAGKIAREDVASLLAKGRRKQEDVQPPSKWRANLPNGASVEFIGLCERPSGGKQWWGPDGSPLGYAPYSNYERHDSPPGDISAYEIAWRIQAAQGYGSGTRVSFEGRSASGPRQIYDRYGNLLRGELEARDYVCDKLRTKTTLKIGVQVNKDEFAWTTFKNVSLVRGENQGFEIVEGEASE
jgi:hypothetical protein